MSLRARITLMNVLLIGAVLFVFGSSVYNLVRIILINQVDETLRQSFWDINKFTTINSLGELDLVTLPTSDLSANVYVQAWGRDGRRRISSINIEDLQQPLDPLGMQSTEVVFRNTVIGDAPLRVLTVPLVIGERPVGRLQIAQSFAVVNDALNALLAVMLIVGVILISIAGAASWLTTKSALRPLVYFTQTALDITTKNDLTRRVPLEGPPDDEIGSLTQTFNQTLSQLERMIQSQRRFLTDVGHEFRTPLTVIRGNVDLMERMGELDEESIEGVQSEVDRLTRLVEDLLLLAQAETGKLPLHTQRIELDSLVLDVLRQSRVLAGGKVNLKLNEIDQLQVCGDPDKLQQVFINLLSNAIKYTPENGDVYVSLGMVEAQGMVKIADTGPGVPEEDLPYIFDRFYRGEKSRYRSKDGKGFGLGLSIAYWIVRNHEGRIEVDSTIGEGTTFCVFLPLAGEDCGDLFD
jgi:two-component system OmpR family sensor kinase